MLRNSALRRAVSKSVSKHQRGFAVGSHNGVANTAPFQGTEYNTFASSDLEVRTNMLCCATDLSECLHLLHSAAGCATAVTSTCATSAEGGAKSELMRA
jgi:hypothetical protein